MLARLAPLAALCLLAACGEGAANKASSSDAEIKAEMAETRAMRPGEYQASVEFTRFDMPGMPAEALAQARQQMQAQTAALSSYCLTEEEAAKSQQDRLRQLSRAQGDCRFETFEVSGERVDGRLACSGMPGGASATIAMNGTMGAEASAIRVTTEMANPAMPAQKAVIEMQVNTRRTGECTAASRAAAEQAAQAMERQAAP